MDRKRRKKLNRELLGIGLLAGLLALTILASFWMCRRHEDMARQLDTAAAFAQAGEWEQALLSADSARQRWEKGWHLAGLLADHTPMEEIDSQFAHLAVWGDARKDTEFAAAGAALARQLMAMADAHRLTWWNLL